MSFSGHLERRKLDSFYRRASGVARGGLDIHAIF